MKNLKLSLSLFLLCLVFATCKKDQVTTMPTVTDVDGNVYHTVKIGTQTWMVENLKTTKFNDGSPIPPITDNTLWKNALGPGYCSYNNDNLYKITYGALYNWHAVGTGILAPKGWHVPTDEDWTTLENTLGGALKAGAKLKEMGINHWVSPNSSATNSSGFTALPGGYRGTYLNSVAYLHVGDEAMWWTSTLDGVNSTSAVFRDLYANSDEVFKDVLLKHYGLSVRCIKD